MSVYLGTVQSHRRFSLCLYRLRFGCKLLFQRMAEVENFEDRRERPGADIEQIERGNCVEISEDGVDPRDAEEAGAGDNDERGNNRFAETAGGGDGAVHKSGDAVGECHDGETFHAGVNDCRVGREQGEKLRYGEYRQDD